MIFGLNLDGGNWPEFEHGCDALLGDVVLGPQGLIGLLVVGVVNN